ncbi:MAG: ABC transporter substrate-binding protein [Leptolyngbya sp. SIO1E4]|nr:ABC transporter substrate-binding protein [Leptolyngbya sp. SIO1E4]
MIAIRKASLSWMKSLILMALSLVLVTACHRSVPPQSNMLSASKNSVEACRTVLHALGEACIPSAPQRIVILDEFFLLDNLSTLGLKPVGYTPCLVCMSSDVLSEYIADVPALGDMEAPALEKIVSLKPDLILGLEWQEKSYPLLSEIAPTVMISDPDTNGFKRTLEYLAEILGKSSQVQQSLAEYDKKVEEFRQQFAEKMRDKEISIIGVDDSAFYAEKLGNRIYNQVMADLGIQFSSAHESIKTNGYTPLSIEALPDWDADFLFVLQNYERHAEDLASMMKHPIWSTLSVVQNGKVHPIVLDVWGPITANHFIDDLYQYFITFL